MPSFNLTLENIFTALKLVVIKLGVGLQVETFFNATQRQCTTKFTHNKIDFN